jgi:hypothetical protein
MEPERTSQAPGLGCIVDLATLYLCRHRRQWVVVLESPAVTVALPLPRAPRDSLDAQFDLLELAGRACPDAAIVTTDGTAEQADYEWRIEVRGVTESEGALGQALHHALTTRPLAHRRRLAGRATQRHCHRGWSPASPGRPRAF